MEYRVGIGYDVHRLEEGRRLILGGIEVPFEKGLQGHSDADVLLHALMDALLGAAGLGDIGLHFPDDSDANQDISSLELLGNVKTLLDQESNQIGNIDLVLMAERPKIISKIGDMKAKIAAALDIEPDKINIKATTTEKLGFVGREEGMAAQAACILCR